MDKIGRVAARVASEAEREGPFLVVVSARGGTTDDLLGLAGEAGGSAPDPREVDQLLSTGEIAAAAQLALSLGRLSVPAVSLTGAQAGIEVTGPGGKGVIASVDATRIRAELSAGRVVVVAGFQGVNADGDVVTLGRGGSDTTAVALAVALGAERCEIYTDVDGVYTVDPRVVTDARKLSHVDPQVMSEMAFAGAKVLHSRSAQLAANHDMEVHVRGAADEGPGTVIARRPLETAAAVSAVTCDPRIARVLIRSPQDHDLAPEVLLALSRHAIPVDLVARSGPAEQEFRMGFTIDASNLDLVRQELLEIAGHRDAMVVIDQNVSKVSVIGPGLRARPEYIARTTAALADSGIDVSWVALSASRVSVTVPRDRKDEAVVLLHKEFERDMSTAEPISGRVPKPRESVEDRRPQRNRGKPLMTFNHYARELRLQRLRHHSDKLMIVPLDHSIADGPLVGPEGLDPLVGELAANGVDAIIVHKGSIRRIRHDRLRDMSLIVHLNASTRHAPDPDEKYLVTGVEESLRLGADAVSVHINVGSNEERRQIADLSAVAEACDRWNLPLLAMVYPRGPKITGPATAEMVSHAAILAADLGADIVKTPFVGPAEVMAEITAACPIPLVVAGGAAQDSPDRVLSFVTEALSGGVAGLAMGRNVFQAGNPGRMARAVSDLVHADGDRRLLDELQTLATNR